MATFHFDLVSPEKLLFSGDVDQVDVPGAEGDFGVLAGHSPLVATLRPGILTVRGGASGERKIVVLGGFAEVSPEGLTVLANVAENVADIDRAMITTRIGELEQRIAKTPAGSELDKLIARLDHYKTIDRHLIGTAAH